MFLYYKLKCCIKQLINNLGVMTVYYKQSEPTEGFNATYVVFSCPDFCPPTRVCHHNRCVCQKGSTGVLCQDLICPNGCNHAKGHGKCDHVSIFLSNPRDLNN